LQLAGIKGGNAKNIFADLLGDTRFGLLPWTWLGFRISDFCGSAAQDFEVAEGKAGLLLVPPDAPLDGVGDVNE